MGLRIHVPFPCGKFTGGRGLDALWEGPQYSALALADIAIYILDNIIVRPSGCVLWTGPIYSAQGYGTFQFPGYSGDYAHRAVWSVFHGPIPKGLFVCHRCDVPQCVNPLHLFVGTAQDNVADRDRKGRTACGEAIGHSKLTEAQVLEILSLDISKRGALKAAAAKYGVTSNTLINIRAGRSWKHVTRKAA